MTQSLRIVVAHPNSVVRDALKSAIAIEWSVIASCATAAALGDAARDDRVDLLITGVEFPDGDGLETVFRLGLEKPTPAVIVATDASKENVIKAIKDHVMAYLVEPIRPDELRAAAMLAWTRFEQWRELHEQVGDLKQALADRKIIERAKGILMATERLSEGEAFARLRSEAQDRRIRLADVAAQVAARAERAAGGHEP